MAKVKVVVASKNPVKIQCALSGFEKVFKNDQISVSSVAVNAEVPAQPMSDEETLQGAINRAKNAQLKLSAADFWIGIEGGIQDDGNEMEAFAWVYIITTEKAGKARTASFELPSKISELVRSGMELGHADDMVFDRKNSKQGNGAVGILTHELIDRAAYYEPAVILALIPFINPRLY